MTCKVCDDVTVALEPKHDMNIIYIISTSWSPKQRSLASDVVTVAREHKSIMNWRSTMTRTIVERMKLFGRMSELTRYANRFPLSVVRLFEIHPPYLHRRLYDTA